MVDESKEISAPEAAEAEVGAEPAADEIIVPQTKYEMIMMAAAEATRLNEEMRRKGIKVEGKVTLEALRRVRDGKVKAVLQRGLLFTRSEAAAPVEPLRDALFLDQSLTRDDGESDGEPHSGGGAGGEDED